MITPKNKPVTTAGSKRVLFINELESLLLVGVNTAGIPEPIFFNQPEEAGNYLVYLSKLAKQSEKDE